VADRDAGRGAGSVGRSKNNYLSAQHARLMARRGRARAQVGVAHSILVSAYYMLSRDEPYRAISDRTGSAAATTRHTPAGWSPSCSDSATPSSSTPRPEAGGDTGVTTPRCRAGR
jgi:hypothetical protein